MVAKPGHGLGSISLCKRGLCQGVVVHLWLTGLTWRVGLRLVQLARSLLVVGSLPFWLILGRMGVMEVGTPDVLQSSASSSSSSVVFQVGMFSQFLDQWRNITCNRIVLSMVQGHHLQLRSCPSLVL